jgi:uncharacterized protein (DUF1800 family)
VRQYNGMRYTLLSYALVLTVLSPGGRARVALPAPAEPALSARDSALHALNRLAYGPRPGELDRIAAAGVMRWVDAQLDPGKLDDRALSEWERLPVLGYDRAALAQVYTDAERERRDAAGRAPMSMADSAPALGPRGRLGRALADQYVDLALVRAAFSERQLYEVMVDFWTNHFNVLFAKGADRFLLPDYIEHTIRPHAFGRFADLLVATAESPAMLFYLDNWESVTPGSEPPRRRFGFVPADPARRVALARMPRGLNENYARELLELHTLGVDGGYTQQDVINVARIFTGWSIERPQRGGGFQFHDWAHDYGSKVVLGVQFPAGHGQDEGVRLLRWLANQPATMHHVSRALCQRLVRDDPPDGCIDDAVAAWQRSGGEIAAVLRAIVHGQDFWAPASVGAKVKTPLAFLVSALRVTGAQPDTALRLPQVVARLGEPLFMHAAPDGYPDSAGAWMNSGALFDRMNTAMALAADRLPGARVDLDRLLGAPQDPAALVAAVNTTVLAGTMTANTTRVIQDEISSVPNPVAARALAVGLAMGGPEFQRK